MTEKCTKYDSYMTIKKSRGILSRERQDETLSVESQLPVWLTQRRFIVKLKNIGSRNTVYERNLQILEISLERLRRSILKHGMKYNMKISEVLIKYTVPKIVQSVKEQGKFTKKSATELSAVLKSLGSSTLKFSCNDDKKYLQKELISIKKTLWLQDSNSYISKQVPLDDLHYKILNSLLIEI